MAPATVGTEQRVPNPSDVQHLVDQLIVEVLDSHVQDPNTSHYSEIRALVREVVVNTMDRLAATHDLCWECDLPGRCVALTIGVSE
ncbi:MAG: hypothetical protein EPO21_23520 [Chloroflexota bacterium]|nr:MAG: hypothetical protein EPO21_23520 [Chloroflexota bacterium]